MLLPRRTAVRFLVAILLPVPAASGISEQTLAGRLATLKDDLLLRIAAVASAPTAFSGPAPTTPVSTATFATSQRIDQLTNTAINTPTITGGSILGASVSGYLPLSGGTLTGTLSGTDLSLSGTLSAGTLNVAGVSSQGALVGPYFTATSTTATSSFAGGLTAANGNFSILQNGNVGIGNTSPGVELDIGNSSETSDADLRLFTASTYSSKIRFREASDAFGFTLQYAGAGDRFGIIRNDNDATGVEALSILRTSGNVGIGTTSPAVKLHVEGGSLWLANGSGGGIGGAGKGLRAFYDLSNDRAEVFAYDYNGNVAKNLVLQSPGGNVGIGTTSPNAKLNVYSGAAGVAPNTSADDFVIESNTAAGLSILTGNNSTARLFFGNTSDNIVARVDWDDANNLFTIGTSKVGAGDVRILSGNESEVVRITSTGNVGIGTTTPTAQFSTTGTVRFAGLGSGGANLVTDALGNVTASSDERLKDKQGDFTRGLAAINAISPVLYKWRPETGFDTQSTYAGFFAQNVQAAIPEAVSPDSRGYLTLADRPILAALVNAVKELTQRFADFAERITTKELTFDRAHGNEIGVHKLCVDDICVTREQFAAMVAAAGQTAGASPLSIPTSAPQAPAIELNGNASSTIELGDTYIDLGARIVAPTSDLDLGLIIILDGATTTAVSIDTSTPGEHTILYTVTSPTTGLTSSVMRTVTVQPAADFGMTSPQQDESQPPADVQSINDNPAPAEDANPFNEPPANDNASATSSFITEPAAVSL